MSDLSQMRNIRFLKKKTELSAGFMRKLAYRAVTLLYVHTAVMHNMLHVFPVLIWANGLSLIWANEVKD